MALERNQRRDRAGAAVQRTLTQPARGDMLAGTTYFAASQPFASGGTLVVIGTGNQAAINAAADWITRDTLWHDGPPPSQ